MAVLSVQGNQASRPSRYTQYDRRPAGHPGPQGRITTSYIKSQGNIKAYNTLEVEKKLKPCLYPRVD